MLACGTDQIRNQYSNAWDKLIMHDTVHVVECWPRNLVAIGAPVIFFSLDAFATNLIQVRDVMLDGWSLINYVVYINRACCHILPP